MNKCICGSITFIWFGETNYSIDSIYLKTMEFLFIFGVVKSHCVRVICSVNLSTVHFARTTPSNVAFLLSYSFIGIFLAIRRWPHAESRIFVSARWTYFLSYYWLLSNFSTRTMLQSTRFFLILDFNDMNLERRFRNRMNVWVDLSLCAICMCSVCWVNVL